MPIQNPGTQAKILEKTVIKLSTLLPLRTAEMIPIQIPREVLIVITITFIKKVIGSRFASNSTTGTL